MDDVVHQLKIGKEKERLSLGTFPLSLPLSSPLMGYSIREITLIVRSQERIWHFFDHGQKVCLQLPG
jgi:hypothetical protein